MRTCKRKKSTAGRGEDVEGLGPHTAGGDAEWRHHLRKQCVRSYKVQHTFPHDRDITFLAMCPKEMRAYVHAKASTDVFTTALFVIVPNRKHPEWP